MTNHDALTKEKEELAQKNHQLQAMLAAAAPNFAAIPPPPVPPPHAWAQVPTSGMCMSQKV